MTLAMPRTQPNRVTSYAISIIKRQSSTVAVLKPGSNDPTNNTAAPPMMEPATAPNEKSIDDLRQWLQPTDFLSPGNEYAKHLNSYVQGTGDWLRESEAFRKWEDGTKQGGCLWVRGLPGIGKSVFAASTVKTLAETQDSEGRRAPVLFFFFRQIVEKNHDPKYLVRDWTAQLLPFSDFLRGTVAHLSRESCVEGLEMTKLWDTLVGALERIDKVYCVADALDEMDDQHATFVEKLRELGMRKPETIKVLLTSRPVPRIEAQLRDTAVEAVRLDPVQIYPDIVAYVDSRLHALEPRVSEEKEIQVQKAICERANGLFLYARLTMDSLTEGLQEGSIIENTLPTSLEQLPMNLKELYTNMLAEHSRRSGVTQEQQFTILQCVTHSTRPLRLIELGSIIALLRKDTGAGLKEGKDLVRRSCGRLLEILEDESVSVIHHSFTEFARDKSRKSEPGAFPVLDEKEAQKMMLQVCLDYLDSCVLPKSVQTSIEAGTAKEESQSNDDVDTDNGQDDDQYNPYDNLDSFDDRSGRERADEKKHQEIQDLRDAYPLMSYATENLESHIRGVAGQFDILDSYFAPGKNAFEIWLLARWAQYRHGKVQPLHIAASLGLTEYSQYLITHGSEIDVSDAEGRTALSYAAEKGHVEIASILLSNGADPKSDDRVGYTPLHHAVLENRVEISRLLLAAGVSPKIQKTKYTPENILEQFDDDRGETPLQYACQRGNADIMTHLIEFLDKEDAFRCLHWVVWSGKPEAVESILKTGKASVNVFIDGITALSIAVNAMTPDIIEILLRYGADVNLRIDKEVHWYRNDYPDAETKYGPGSETGPTLTHVFAGINSDTVLWGEKERAAKCLKLLVEAGGDVNATTTGNHTPLHYSVKQRFTLWGDWGSEKTEEIVTELLLQHGADANARCDGGATPLHKISPQRPELVDILIRHGADINARNNGGSTPLLSVTDSISGGWNGVTGGNKPELSEQTLLKLLEYGADATVEDNEGSTVLHHMFANIENFKSEKLWKAFIKAGADLNKPNKHGKPPFLSMKNNRNSTENEKLFDTLLEAGLQINATDSSENTVLFKLFESYDLEVSAFQKLLNLGCSAQARDQEGATLLHRCIRRESHFKIFEFLVRAGADPLALDNDGNTIFHEVASIHPTSDFRYRMKTLVNLGIPTDSQNKAGMTALHVACATRPSGNSSGGRERTEEFLDLLLSGTLCPISNVNSIDNIGASPIHYASSFSEYHVGRILRAGADPTPKTHQGLTPLHIAARGRQSGVIALLLSEYRKRGNLESVIDACDDTGRTAFHYSCRSGRPESVRYLLSAGANFEIRDKNGRTPFHALSELPEENLLWASKNTGEFDAAGITLEDSIRPCPSQTLESRFSDTVRTKDIIHLLETSGADLQATCEDNGQLCTAMDLAVGTKCTEMVNELRSRGFSAKDPAAEALIPLSEGEYEARALFERVEPSQATHQKVDASKKDHSKKFREILKRGDYQLFRDFEKSGGDLKAYGGCWLNTGLHALVEWGHADLLEEFVEQAARFHEEEYMQTEDNPGTLLCHACEQSLPRMNIIKVLVEKVQVDVNQISDRYGFTYKGKKATALHWLAAGAHFWNIEAIEYLLSHGADIEAKNGNGDTPLMAAVGSDHPNGFWKEGTMRVLLEHGANPNALNNSLQSCLNMADDASVVRLLLQYGADITLGKIPPLTSAVHSMDTSAARLLLEAGADSNTGGPLYEAAKHIDTEANHDPYLGQKQKDMISLLLEYGADPFAYQDDGFSTFQKVIEEHGSSDQFLELKEFPEDLIGHGGRTPLISTCYPKPTPAEPRYSYGKPIPKPVCTPSAALALIRKGADVNAKDELGRTALHWICTMQNELDEPHQAVVKGLIDASPDLVHHRDSEGFKPLHLAAAGLHTHAWIIDYFISCGCDPAEPDPAGNTVLHYLAPQLLGEKTKALETAERFKNFLTLGLPIDHRNDLGETPLFRFMCKSWNGTTCSGESHPTYAIANDITHVKALPIFLDAGADLQVRNNQGEGLLHATAKRWRKKKYIEGDQEADMLGIFKELMAKGLDPRAEDSKFRTAIDVAVASQNSFLVDLFGQKEREKGLMKHVAISDTESEGDGSEELETDGEW